LKCPKQMLGILSGKVDVWFLCVCVCVPDCSDDHLECGDHVFCQDVRREASLLRGGVHQPTSIYGRSQKTMCVCVCVCVGVCVCVCVCVCVSYQCIFSLCIQEEKSLSLLYSVKCFPINILKIRLKDIHSS